MEKNKDNRLVIIVKIEKYIEYVNVKIKLIEKFKVYKICKMQENVVLLT